LFVLCFSDEAKRALDELAFPEVVAISRAEFEAGDEALAAAKRNRTTIEYYFTCTGSWLLFLLRRYPDVTSLTYLDADLFFYSDPGILDASFGDDVLILSPHRFSRHLRELERFGIFNAGWLHVRRDPRALEALSYWRARCIEWCYERIEDGRYADQRYLDDFETRFAGVGRLASPGANLAPWNYHDHRIVHEADGRVTVDGHPLVFFHFHGLREVFPNVFDPFFRGYGKPTRSMVNGIFTPYLVALAEAGRLPAVRRVRLRKGVRPAPVLNRPGLRKRIALLRRYLIRVGDRVVAF
jgi:hypothetical protein